MNIIKNEVNTQLVIKNSKFICFLYKVQTIDDIKNILNELKSKYKDCDHCCYGYILKDRQKYDDDKEPSGTAGLPILEVLLSNNLVNTLAIVIRYFGGIKLGVGGLSRAYSKTVKEALLKAENEEYVEYETILIETDFNNLKKLNYLLKDHEIIEKIFNENIIYKVKIKKKTLEETKKMLNGYKII